MAPQDSDALDIRTAGRLALLRHDKLMLVINCQFQQLKLKSPLRIENAKNSGGRCTLEESKNSKLSRGKSRSTVH